MIGARHLRRTRSDLCPTMSTLVADANNPRTHRATPRTLFLAWIRYQRRSEVLAPLMNAQLLFVPNLFTSRLLRPLDYVYKLVVTTWHMQRYRPELLVLQGPPHFGALPALLMGVPYVVDAHNAVFQSFWRNVPLATFVLRRAKSVIVHNVEICRLASRQHPGVKFHVIADPIEDIRPAGAATRKDHILFVCSFSEDEPVDTIIEVIEAVPEHEFVITADVGKLSRERRRRLTRCRNLRLTGYLSTLDYHTLLCTSRAAIALTTQDATQQSGACEALSSDTPLITSRTSLSEALFGDWAMLVDNEAGSIIRALRALPDGPCDLAPHRRRWNQEVRRTIRELYRELA